MVHRTRYGCVLTPELAEVAYGEAIDKFGFQTLVPVLQSLAQATRPFGTPTSYGVVPPTFDQGLWANGYQWSESSDDTIARVIWGVLTGSFPEGLWVDFQIGFRGGNITAPFGPYGKARKQAWAPGDDFFSIFEHSLLVRCFDQTKKRASGIWFSRKFQIKPNVRRSDSRRVPFR